MMTKHQREMLALSALQHAIPNKTWTGPNCTIAPVDTAYW